MDPGTNEMSCKELTEVITEYLEGTLPEAERARFEYHLGLCPGCQTYLEQMRLTVRAVGRLSEESIPPEVRDQLLAAFRGWKKP
ncbi:MAG: zf-HC2 domain-containing protein [Acidobacteria bacterium]|nr:zf-HC2 domain-containing protein [Acidobacteriota bacterium]